MKFGIISDVQYGDIDDKGSNRHRTSLDRLQKSLEFLHCEAAVEVVQCGDLIESALPDDNHPTNRIANLEFDKVLSVIDKSPCAVHHVLGNHCAKRGRALALDRLGLSSRPNPYYSLLSDHSHVRLIILDSLDETPLAAAASSVESAQRARDWVAEHRDQQTHALDYNGAIGETQLAWFREQLRQATVDNVTFIVIFTHIPIYSGATSPRHLLFNHDQVRTVIRDEIRANQRVLVVAGHWHAGGYAQESPQVHHLTVPAILSSADDELGCGFVLNCTEATLQVTAFGREAIDLLPSPLTLKK